MSKMAKCVSCNNNVSTTAKVCPHCGEKNPVNTTQDMIFIYGITVVIMGLVYYFL